MAWQSPNILFNLGNNGNTTNHQPAEREIIVFPPVSDISYIRYTNHILPDLSDITPQGSYSYSFSNVDFTGLHARLVIFKDSQFWIVNFTNANLTNSTFINVRCYDTTFYNADLTHSNITTEETELIIEQRREQATRSTLPFILINIFTNCKFSGAILNDATIANAIIEGDCSEYTDMQFINATLTNVRFQKTITCNLSGADFTGATLTDVDLTHVNLTNANFTNATLTNVDFTGSTLVNVITVGATLNNVTNLNHNQIGTLSEYQENENRTRLWLGQEVIPVPTLLNTTPALHNVARNVVGHNPPALHNVARNVVGHNPPALHNVAQNGLAMQVHNENNRIVGNDAEATQMFMTELFPFLDTFPTVRPNDFYTGQPNIVDYIFPKIVVMINGLTAEKITKLSNKDKAEIMEKAHQMELTDVDIKHITDEKLKSINDYNNRPFSNFNAKKPIMINELTQVFNKLNDSNMVNFPINKLIFGKCFDFVFSQTNDFKKSYIEYYTDSTFNAYPDSRVTISCVKGIVERVYLVLGQVAFEKCPNKCTDIPKAEMITYKKLQALLLNPSRIDEFFQEWSEKYVIDETENANLINSTTAYKPTVNDADTRVVDDIKTIQNRKDQFRQFIKRRHDEEYATYPKLDKDITNYVNGQMSYIFTNLQLGGKRKRTRTKRRGKKTSHARAKKSKRRIVKRKTRRNRKTRK